ncbi:hypothetical protein GGR58DRAFT_276937 [Xylaria digitata]|nr:hypothetical protein GGR58DRAFT_276937 [Xylaria digitata]
MLRRSHKKTRKGSKCEECRRRHIRCDQQRPTCINCQNSDRVCIFRHPTEQSRVIQQSSASDAASPNSNNTPLAVPSCRERPRELSQTHSLTARTPNSPLINVLHLELFNHFIQGTFLFIDRETAFTDQLKKTTLSSAFSNSYLMHGILAFSARHVSSIQIYPERSRYYLNHATKLQTWAVANFNPAPPEPSQDTCVALFLFSSLTCMHGLADIALLNLDPEPFFIRFGHYFGLQRGVRTIANDYWSQLEESEIQNLLQCIRQLVMQSTDLSPEAIEACHLAIEQLQCVLDECGSHRLIPVHCVFLTLAWPLLVPEKMVDLLVLRRPVALIILAYYGAMLNLCRDLWMVGHAGKNIVHAINTYLGPNWASWLLWPCDAVGIETLQSTHSPTTHLP